MRATAENPMFRFRPQSREFRKKKPGLPPGTAVFVGERRLEKPLFSKLTWNETGYHEIKEATLEQCLSDDENANLSWINIDGIHEVEDINAIGEHFGFHPLTIEDIVNTTQRPKMEDFDNYIFVVLKMLTYNKEANELSVEQVSIVYGEKFVVTFQEGLEGDVFEPIREHVREGKGRICKLGGDYLAYSLMDAVVDHYFLILEELGSRIEEIENTLVSNPNPSDVKEIHRLKRGMMYMRKSIWPLREEIAHLEKSDSPIIHKATKLYLRDLYDHTIEVIDTVETYRDMLSGMHDTYLSSISNRMNEIMKVLTIISTIFIPLTFIAGVYGMNFDYMPELRSRWGYFIVLIIMGIIAALMLWYFRRKKWL